MKKLKSYRSHIEMSMNMKLQIVSRDTIKPSSSTPPHLNIHTLSLFDQIAPHLYVPLVFFFPHDDASSGNDHGVIDRSELLRQSLSRTLSRYYPFAGRIKDNVSIECNDEGATFVEARLKSMTVSEILENPRSEIVELLFVDGSQWKDSKSGRLLKVQITLFECGGLGIGVLLSHKLGDMATLVKFIQDWAVMSRDSGFGEQIVKPLFSAADLFPHGDLPPMSGAVIEEAGNSTCNRFVFEGSKIAALKNAISDKVKNPSRVEVVLALIYKAIISASRYSNSNPQNHPTLMLQTINLRPRMEPPLSESTVGSLVSFFPVAAAAGEREVELHELVSTMREELGEFCNKYVKKYRTKEWLNLIKKRFNESRELLSRNQLVYRCSSGCKFPIYEVNFGWGAAAWVAMAAFKMKNTVMMLDAKNDGGIEALISLEDMEMTAFQHNEELLAYASLNPSANYAN